MKDQKIIIKKVKKVSGGGHHGGSWKVAYADFVTAMMAFFLLLWLLSMVAPEKRARVSTYFKNFSLFTTSGTSMVLEKSGEIFEESGQNPNKALSELYGPAGELSADYIRNIIKKAVETRLAGIQDQIFVSVVEDGVRIEMVDKEGNSMFKPGSTDMTDQAKKILSVLSENIKGIDNKIYIGGHTDSQPFSSLKYYSNWELSSERANAARKQLEEFGVDSDRITKVVGYAHKVPLVTDNPEDPRNRRISITMSFQKQDTTIPSIDLY